MFVACAVLTISACGARSELIVTADAGRIDASSDDVATDTPRDTTRRDAPVIPPPPRSLSLGTWHSCVVRHDGAFCWGMNTNGQLGDGTTTDRHTPVRIESLSDRAVAFALGQSFGCALIRDGSVECAGRVGNDPIQTMTFVPVPGVTDAVQIGAGAAAACAVRRDGSLVCWGDSPAMPGRDPCGLGGYRAPAVVDGVRDAIEVSLGDTHACARHRDGTVSCWGCNRHGQLGNGTWRSRVEPRPVDGLEDAVAIALRREQSCAVRADGSVWCWGSNHYGQLFDPVSDDVLAARVASDIETVRDVATTTFDTCYRLADGRVACRGTLPLEGMNGGCTGHLSDARAHVVADLDRVTSFAVGEWHFCALRDDDAVLCWGCNSFGQVGNGTVTVAASPAVVLP